jgi:CubicO group peptidase (beta-lactamase class C family)
VGTATTTGLQSLLKELAAKYGVPGATAAVLHGDELTEAATGVINGDTGVEATADTLFQIGSITKVYTATLVMQLVDEGKIELNEPVRTYLPELKFADPAATESITVRQLLCHTSGVAGDHLDDTGRGDDCITRYVAGCANLPQVTRPGAVFSYCNVGFVVAGRLVERLTGQTWDAALKTRLFDPMGTQRTVTLPEDAILYRAAVGHLDPTRSGELIRAPFWMWPRSTGPAGLVITSAAELLTFARVHLDGGIADDGTQVLSRASVRAMQERQVDCADRTFGDAWGLGWALLDWDGQRLIGHDGAGIGQLAFLLIVPDARFAVALLTNGITAQYLSREFFKRVFAERLGMVVPDAPKATTGTVPEPARYAGTYENADIRYRIQVHDGSLVGNIDFGGPMKEMYAPVRGQLLHPIDDTTFLIHIPDWNDDWKLVFSDFDESGRPVYLHCTARAYPRVD